jgi:hypothetical protein
MELLLLSCSRQYCRAVLCLCVFVQLTAQVECDEWIKLKA